MAPRERRSVRRTRLKVIHRHRLGRQTFRRVSELVFKLRRARGARHTWFYDGETSDPRFDELPPAGTGLAP